MRVHLQTSAAKNYFLGFATSAVLLFVALLYFQSSNSVNNVSKENKISFAKIEKINLSEFDPNDLNEKDWQNLGFSKRQIATILKYKDVVGGNFDSKEQLKKCYAISAEKFEELESFILLPETSSKTTKNYSSSNYSGSNINSSYSHHYEPTTTKKLIIPGKFNPDHFSVRDFVKMGFTEKQANSILKYKNYLGGSFISKEKFKDCFIISEENYNKMEPYLLLPEKSNYNKGFQPKFSSNIHSKSDIHDEKFDPNVTDFEGWKKFGFSDKQAQVIINYRDKNLKGSFKNLDDLANCFVISAEKFEEMKPFIVLNPDNFKENSLNKNEKPIADSNTNFSNLDLNQISYKQLIEFGFDEKSAAMMLSFRKKLGGFVNKQQIIDTYEIDKNLAQKLIATSKLDDSKVAKYTLATAPEEWLKNHPYFKYSADKIIFYRLTNPDDKKIWKFIKVKPEYETKMRLYLK